MARYDVLAKLFAHPGPSLEADLKEAIALHEDAYPTAARALQKLAELLPLDDMIAMQELHTRTFDVQAITSLDIGYTLFGEDYKRGALLAHLSREHVGVGNDCGVELADNLSNVLRLLPKLRDEALREEFVHVLLAPAIREMIREFEPACMAKKEDIYKKHHKTIIEVAEGDRRTAYRCALQAVYEVLKKDFALKIGLPTDRESKFATSVGMEMGIESSGPCAAK